MMRRSALWRQILASLLALAALGFLLLTVAVLLARQSWLFDLLTHFRRQYVAALLVLLLAALAARAWRSGAVFAALTVFHGWAVVGPSASAAPVIKAGQPLRVTIMNVHYANQNRTAILDYVRATKPDILVVEEAWADHWADTRRELASMFAAQAPETAVRESVPFVFSRHPITAYAIVRPLDEPFGLLRAELDVSGAQLTLLALHPPYPMQPRFAETRNAHLAFAAQTAAERQNSVIVAGDFNVTPWSPFYADMSAAEGLRNAAGNAALLSTWPTWFWPAGIPIDHVMIKGDLSAVEVARGPDIGSDHYPLTVDLVIGR